MLAPVSRIALARMSCSAWAKRSAAASSGLIFGVGLAVSRMTDPEKVKSFLDVAAIGDGNWDPSLAFVMGGGLLVMMLFYRFSRPMSRPRTL